MDLFKVEDKTGVVHEMSLANARDMVRHNGWKFRGAVSKDSPMAVAAEEALVKVQAEAEIKAAVVASRAPAAPKAPAPAPAPKMATASPFPPKRSVDKDADAD